MKLILSFFFLLGEAERIKRCKGRVFALQDEPEVQRVWLPFDDAPGLAMARAFGDFCLKDYGLISIPEFSHRLLTEKDQFIVLASDGVSIISALSACTFAFLVTELKQTTRFDCMMFVCAYVYANGKA